MGKQVYWVWADMLSRCRNPQHKAFPNYGGRGIAVCERWERFANFAADMGERPAGGMLDRIDNNEGYSPTNCRWATRAEQNSNRRNCIYLEHNGERVTLREYCRREGLGYRAIAKRITSRNWPVQKAVSVPLGTGKHFLRVPENGERHAARN
jgi:hypothetical protein